ncbi:MAG: hypothetical protein P8Y23_03570 [Candidatus Lokiarchaeota archaeon]|jgi:hypothetical protein
MENEIEQNFELEQRKEELINEFKSDDEDGELIGEIFYNSMKDFFEFGVELAKDLAAQNDE